MNQRLAKLERRDMRRTIGEVGVTVVETHGEILETQVIPALNALHTVAQDTDRRLSDLEAFRQRKSFRDRLAWVLFGD